MYCKMYPNNNMTYILIVNNMYEKIFLLMIIVLLLISMNRRQWGISVTNTAFIVQTQNYKLFHNKTINEKVSQPTSKKKRSCSTDPHWSKIYLSSGNVKCHFKSFAHFIYVIIVLCDKYKSVLWRLTASQDNKTCQLYTSKGNISHPPFYLSCLTTISCLTC